MPLHKTMSLPGNSGSGGLGMRIMKLKARDEASKNIWVKTENWRSLNVFDSMMLRTGRKLVRRISEIFCMKSKILSWQRAVEAYDLQSFVNENSDRLWLEGKHNSSLTSEQRCRHEEVAHRGRRHGRRRWDDPARPYQASNRTLHLARESPGSKSSWQNPN